MHDPAAGLGHPVAGVEVDVDDGSELLGSLLQRGDGGADPGVVDQDVHPAELADASRDHFLDSLGARQVRRDRDGPAALEPA